MPTSAEHHLRALAELCKKRPQVFGYPVQRLTTPAHGRKHFEKGRGAKPPRGPRVDRCSRQQTIVLDHTATNVGSAHVQR